MFSLYSVSRVRFWNLCWVETGWRQGAVWSMVGVGGRERVLPQRKQQRTEQTTEVPSWGVGMWGHGQTRDWGRRTGREREQEQDGVGTAGDQNWELQTEQ